MISRTLLTAKNFARSRFPRAMAVLRRVRYAHQSKRLQRRSLETVFSEIHQGNAWGSEESVSGEGSTLEQTRIVRTALPELIRHLNVRTMLDAPCGDFHWMKQVPLNVEEYLGGDIVDAIVERNQRQYGCVTSPSRKFCKLDLTCDDLPRVDLVFCRDCLVHLSHRDVARALMRIQASGSLYLLTTTYPNRNWNEDIPTGLWRPLNLNVAPFHLPAAVETIVEGSTEAGGGFQDKCLSLWRIADLPAFPRRQRTPLDHAHH